MDWHSALQRKQFFFQSKVFKGRLDLVIRLYSHFTAWTLGFTCFHLFVGVPFRLDALALSVIATATWLAGWLDVTLQYCIKTAKPIWNFFRPSECSIILVFWDPCADTKFPGDFFTGGDKYTGGAKIGDFHSIFDVHRRLSRKRCEIGRWLLWNVNRKSWVPDWMG